MLALCSGCAVEDVLNPSATLRHGTAYCESCAREMAEQEDAAEREREQAIEEHQSAIAERMERLSRPSF